MRRIRPAKGIFDHLFYLAVAILLVGCSGSEPISVPDEPVTDLSKLSYSLYMTRGSLTSQEFEQYKTLPQGLFVECGTIHRGRPQTVAQGVERNAPEQSQPAKLAAFELLQILNFEESLKLDAAGTGTGFADPGKYILTINNDGTKREIKTSLDWVEQKRTAFSTKLHTFTRLVRGIPATPPCGNAEFYGIAR
jgi:hypothetical protein